MYTPSIGAFNGILQGNKVLKIVQESIYPPDSFNAFTITNGTVAMETGTRIAPLGLNTKIAFNNAAITSTSGTRNGHRGLTIFGQKTVSIVNCTFENGFTAFMLF